MAPRHRTRSFVKWALRRKANDAPRRQRRGGVETINPAMLLNAKRVRNSMQSHAEKPPLDASAPFSPTRFRIELIWGKEAESRLAQLGHAAPDDPSEVVYIVIEGVLLGAQAKIIEKFIDALLQYAVEEVFLDLAHVPAISYWGIKSFLHLQKQFEREGRRMTIVDMHEAVQKSIEEMGLGRIGKNT